MAASPLFEPLTIRRWTLRNRVVMPPMVTCRSIVEPDGIEWYGRHARGGPGLVIVEATGVPGFGSRLTAETLKPLTDAIHAGGALAAIQLFPVEFGQDLQVNELTPADIDAIVEQYARAVEICRAGGFDGVEPHGAHGYLINRFFSPAHNCRKDAYGGSLENRMRFGLDIVRAIRDAIGGDLLLLYRHTPVHDGSYGMDDSVAFARALAGEGVDILDISPSSINAPGDRAAPFMGLGPKVITVAGLDEGDNAEEAIRKGRADLAAIGRGLIADPDWPEKVRTGKRADIVVCTKCNGKCFGNLRKGIPIACAQWDR